MKRLRKLRKESGTIGQLLPSLITIFIVFYLIYVYLGMSRDLELKNRIDMLARQYIIRMETYGKLTADDKTALKNELVGMGCENISFAGTDESEVGYGNKVTLMISGKMPSKRVRWLGGFNTSREKNMITFNVRKASTGKY